MKKMPPLLPSAQANNIPSFPNSEHPALTVVREQQRSGGAVDVFVRSGQKPYVKNFTEYLRDTAPIYTPAGQFTEGYLYISEPAAQFGAKVGGTVGRSVGIATALVPATIWGALKALLCYLQSASVKDLMTAQDAAKVFMDSCGKYVADTKLPNKNKVMELKRARLEIQAQIKKLRGSNSIEMIELYEKVKDDLFDLLANLIG